MVKQETLYVGFAALFALHVAACNKTEAGTDGGTDNQPDAFVPNNMDCPGPLPEAKQSCAAPACTMSTGMIKEFGEATLDSTKGKSWLVITWAVSEIASDNPTVVYGKSQAGALSPESSPSSIQARRETERARARAILGETAFEDVFGDAHNGRIRGEAMIRAMQKPEPYVMPPVSGTAVRGLTGAVLPPNARRAGMACNASAPLLCGDKALCVIPENSTTGDGTCESSLMLKFRTGQTTFDMVTATVKKVGMLGAIVADDQIADTIQQSDIDALIKRFDEHIGPLDNTFFGKAVDAQGRDRDGNGVVMIFMTPRVSGRAGRDVVGFFQRDDLLPTSMEPTSNAADILYMLPPGPMATLEQISGTIAHEYQHMINFYAKKIINNSSQEDTWLDEGLATFAEDMQGYGSDAFLNIAAYLMSVDQISLTGAGIAGDATLADSAGRRGMAHILVRYFFEQHGGASWGSGPADITDKGGVAAVKKLVQSKETGTFLFTKDATGRTFNQWVADLMTTVAVSGAGMPGVSCNPMYHLLAPQTDAYTNYQRGIDLRRSFKDPKGNMVQLMGPTTATLENGDMGPVPGNGGEIRTLSFSGGAMKITVSGRDDFDIGFHALPTDLTGN